MLEMVTSFFHASPSSLISGRVSSRVFAIMSRKRPVPAAHLSFITKFTTLPRSSMRITLESWPPMSMTVRAWGNRKCAPLAWQVISVAEASDRPMVSRP